MENALNTLKTLQDQKKKKHAMKNMSSSIQFL